MLIFGLRSTSHDQLSNLSKKHQLKHKKKQKRLPKSSKNKMFVLDYVQLLMIGQAIQAKNVDQNVKKQKRPPKSSKCSILDYVQLLMIGQAIQAKNVNRNVKK